MMMSFPDIWVHWGCNKMFEIMQMTILGVFSWNETCVRCLKFLWSLLTGVHWISNQNFGLALKRSQVIIWNDYNPQSLFTTPFKIKNSHDKTNFQLCKGVKTAISDKKCNVTNILTKNVVQMSAYLVNRISIFSYYLGCGHFHYVKLSRAMQAPWVDRFLNNEIYCYPLSKKRCGPPVEIPSDRLAGGDRNLRPAAT